MMGDSITRLHTLSERYNTIQDSINEVHRSERELAILRSRRIIVSTTTAAAMQIDLIRAAYPDVVLVEEAGEILESHVVAALTPSVRRLLLIGDHKQLRPKVDNIGSPSRPAKASTSTALCLNASSSRATASIPSAASTACTRISPSSQDT